MFVADRFFDLTGHKHFQDNMRRRGISKFLLAILMVTLLALEVAGLDDNLAMESSVDKVKDERRMEGFDHWSFITGQQQQRRDMEIGRDQHRLDNFNWNFNSESSAEEDEDYDADRRMDDIDWGFISDEEDEEDEAEKRLDDGIDWSFLTENINEEEDEAEHRMDDFDWSWNTPGESSAEEDDVEDVRELEDRDGHNHEHEHEHLPSKWHQKLKRTKFAYGPPKVHKPPKGQYGPPKTPKRPKPQYGAPKATKRPKVPKRTKYGAPKKTHKPSKGQYGPPKTAYHAPAYSQPQQEPSYNQQHQAPVSNSPQSAYKETEPVTYQPQHQATNPLPPAYRQPELASDSPPPASTNYPATTLDYSPASVNIASVSPPLSQPSPVAAYGPVIPTQHYYSTAPNVPAIPAVSYESRTYSPPTRSEIIAPYFRPTEPPRQRLGQSSYEPVSDKNDNPGFFEYANFPNFDDIFKQIFKF